MLSETPEEFVDDSLVGTALEEKNFLRKKSGKLFVPKGHCSRASAIVKLISRLVQPPPPPRVLPHVYTRNNQRLKISTFEFPFFREKKQKKREKLGLLISRLQTRKRGEKIVFKKFFVQKEEKKKQQSYQS